MRTVNSRITKLEDRFGTGKGKQQILMVAYRAGWNENPRCGPMHRDSGRVWVLPTGPLGLVNFLFVPGELDGQELEAFLREHGRDLNRLGIRREEDDQPTNFRT